MKYTIKADLIYEEKIKRSLFIGQLKHVSDMESARTFIQEISRRRPQANHNCPAYILGKTGEICFSSDDREPPGSAGKPILNMLQRHELTNVVLVITRYFGGVKLGIRGLMEAYNEVAEKTVLTGEKTQMVDYLSYLCEMNYDFYNIFSHKALSQEVVISDTKYTNKVEVCLKVSEHRKEELHRVLTEMKNGQKITFREV